MHSDGQGVVCCSGYVPIDVVKWMTRTEQRDVLVLSRCKNFGDGMGGSGEEGTGLGFGLWLASLGWQAGCWLQAVEGEWEWETGV